MRTTWCWSTSTAAISRGGSIRRGRCPGLGATLVELIGGRRPFAGEAPWALLDAIRGGAPATEGLADDVRAIAVRALAPEAGDRFAGVGELRRAVADTRRTREPAGPVELAAWLAALVGRVPR